MCRACGVFRRVMTLNYRARTAGSRSPPPDASRARRARATMWEALDQRTACPVRPRVGTREWCESTAETRWRSTTAVYWHEDTRLGQLPERADIHRCTPESDIPDTARRS